MSGDSPAEDLARLHFYRGDTIAFDALPDRSVALDGYVQGPAIDAARRRFSFDHHAGCVRHATLSTCEMALDAVRVGLDPGDLDLHLNDLDADTVLAAWILLRPAAARARAVAAALRAAGRRDALGPASGEGLVPALRWALQPLRERAAELRLLPIDVWRAVLAACLERLDAWWAAGAPAADAAMPAPVEVAPLVRLLHDGGDWQLVEGPGVGAFLQLYEGGVRAAIVARALADGTTEYTVGKASEFVTGFDVPALLAALRVAELDVNPAQSPAHTWGGGSSIGGSPRNADGSGSRLTWAEVVAVVEGVVEGVVDRWVRR